MSGVQNALACPKLKHDPMLALSYIPAKDTTLSPDTEEKSGQHPPLHRPLTCEPTSTRVSMTRLQDLGRLEFAKLAFLQVEVLTCHKAPSI